MQAQRTKWLKWGMVSAAILCAGMLGFWNASPSPRLPLSPSPTLAHVPTAVSKLSLNDNGWAVWTTGRGNDSQVYVWDGKTVREIGFAGRNNRDGVINLKNWVAWSADRADNSGSDVWLWKGSGTPVCLSAEFLSAAQPALNDRGDVVWWGDAGGKNQGIADVFYLGANAKKSVILTEGDRDGASRNPRISDTGTVSYERSWKRKNIVVTDLVTVNAARPNKRTQITDSRDLNVHNGAISPSGVMTWAQYDDAHKQWQIWKATSSKDRQCLSVEIDGNHHAPDINAAGTVAWHADSKKNDGSALWWHQGKRAESLAVPTSGKWARPVAINNKGMVLYVSGEGSGSGFDIQLKVPNQQIVVMSDCRYNRINLPLLFVEAGVCLGFGLFLLLRSGHSRFRLLW